MSIKIALAGNPNSGKTTLFNALTGLNQYVGNWPGVTVEKKEGKLKSNKDITVTDLPGIYSLSPYTLEEVVARNYLIDESPDVILNIVDGTNLERNLFLTTQLIEMGIPVVVAINMMDVVRKKGDRIDIKKLSKELGARVVEISALKEEGVFEAAQAAIESVNETWLPRHSFSGPVEHFLAHIEEAILHDLPDEQQRFYSMKLFERDTKIIEKLQVTKEQIEHIEKDIRTCEKQLNDDSESIIITERYNYIDSIVEKCVLFKDKGRISTSEKIDKVVTNRFAALPIFAVIMFMIYFISVSTVGALLTDWANDGVFGEGWHFFGIGLADYEDAMNQYTDENVWTDEMQEILEKAQEAGVIGAEDLQGAIDDKSFADFDQLYQQYSEAFAEKGFDIVALYEAAFDEESEDVPEASDYGIWVKGIPVLAEEGLEKAGTPAWLNGLLIDGIIGGVGAVLGFAPQMLILFLLLAFLEGCGYMSRIAFVMDRIFRKFGLSGKSFIPMLIGTGCSVPGIMASRTIENDRDRKMTIMTTSFIPCGAKLPIIALITAVLFDGAWWVAPSAYFLGIFAVVISGIILKKTKLFAGDVAPFIMELPAYHWPTIPNLLRSMWERGWSFIKKAGTVILLASIVIWGGSVFGIENGAVIFSPDMALEDSLLGILGNALSWLFAPLGFGNIKATIATVMGLIAKEEVVGVFGVLDFEGMTKLSAYSFLVFNLLCAPCFAAMGAIRREMNNWKWTAFAITYQCVFAYAISLIIYQIGMALTGGIQIVGFVFAICVACGLLYMLLRKEKTRKEV